MAQTSIYTEERGSIRATIAAFFARLGEGSKAYMAAQARAEEYERLNAMSDAQLAAQGLTREGIARHVFRDMLHM